MTEFFAMGGYAVFLWPAYLITLIAIVANVLIARRAHDEAKQEARRRFDLEDEGSTT